MKAELPRGWHTGGSNPEDYDMGMDSQAVRSGRTSAFIKSKAPEAQGVGMLMQSFAAGEYRGKRLRLSGYAKSDGVAQRAALWMHIAGEQRTALAYDNMQDRPIKGTTEWTRYEIVLDVSPKSAVITFGLLLQGKGTVWVDDLKLEVVSEAVPVTFVQAGERKEKRQPRNLGFE